MSHSISFWIESRFNFTASYSQKPVAIQKRRVSYELTECRFISELNVRASGCNLRSSFKRRASSSPTKVDALHPTLWAACGIAAQSSFTSQNFGNVRLISAAPKTSQDLDEHVPIPRYARVLASAKTHLSTPA